VLVWLKVHEVRSAEATAYYFDKELVVLRCRYGDLVDVDLVVFLEVLSRLHDLGDLADCHFGSFAVILFESLSVWRQVN
jgi:hypothetical protein